jgi:hypothetical protein
MEKANPATALVAAIALTCHEANRAYCAAMAAGQRRQGRAVRARQHRRQAGRQPRELAGRNPLELLSICILVMKNGFTVIGKSAPASPENFNAEFGKKLAYEDCIRQLWPLMGFALRDAAGTRPAALR